MIIGACVVHNNVDIFKRTLESFKGLCDKLFVIDDGSTECTYKERWDIIENIYGSNFVLTYIPKTGKEIERRTILWKNLCQFCDEFDWIVLLDSDECYHIKDLQRLKKLMITNKEHEGINWISTRLYNMWSETEYRVDGYWNPKFDLKRRIFKLRKGEYRPQNFNSQTIECGEVPAYVHTIGGINTECKLLHLGYITESERQRKYAFHKKVDPEGKFHLKSHIDSIIGKPTLITLT